MGVRRISSSPAMTRRAARSMVKACSRHLWRRGSWGCSAYGRAQSGEEFLHSEGFGDVVVGAGIERAYLCPFFVAGRQNDHRRSTPSAQSLDHCNAVEVGQAQVQDHDIRWRRAGGGQSRRTGRRRDHLVTSCGERDLQGTEQLSIIIDGENACHR